MTPRLAPPSAALAARLDAALAWPPEYGPGLASHLPMALAALDGLGADAKRLQAFAERYQRRFAQQPAAAEGDLAAGPARSAALGDFRAFAAWRAEFAHRLASEGTAATLRSALPLLMPGVAAAAFHGAIRTAHAVESGHPGELAAALAYWAARWMPLGAPDRVPPRFDQVAPWLHALAHQRRTADAAWQPSGALITGRLRSAMATTAWRQHADALAPRDAPHALRDLARACADLYAATGDFTALHMATGSRAARVLAPWLDACDPAVLRPLWHAIAAARLTVDDAAPDAKAPPDPPADWDTVRRLALESDDDHVIKLVHAMLAQARQADPTGQPDDPVWLRAAWRAVAPAR